MDAPSYDAIARALTQGWDDAWFRRGVIGLLGLLVLVQTGRTAWARQARVLSLLLWATIGVILVTLAVYPVPVLNSVMSVEYFARIRFIMGAVSLLVLVITIEAVRRGHLQERYALLWMLTGVFMLAIVAVPGSLALFRAVTGMGYAAALAAVAFIFLVLVSFHFSIALSALHAKLARLSQQIALLETDLRATATLPVIVPWAFVHGQEKHGRTKTVDTRENSGCLSDPGTALYPLQRTLTKTMPTPMAGVVLATGPCRPAETE